VLAGNPAERPVAGQGTGSVSRASTGPDPSSSHSAATYSRRVRQGADDAASGSRSTRSKHLFGLGLSRQS